MTLSHDLSDAAHAALPLYPGPAAWTAEEMRRRDDWIVPLTPSDVAELRGAAADSARRGVALTEITPAAFPLPGLGAKLTETLDQVVNGRGFALLRGLPVADMDRAEAARVYLGLGAWLGAPVPQNAMGHILGHVTDLGVDPTDPKNRVYQTSYRHLFHTDSCDIVCLLCLQPAKRGGQSAIASSTALYNEIARRRPDLAEVLARPFHLDRKGEIPAGKGPTYPLAVFHHCAGRMTAIYARDFIEAAQRFDHVPRLTAEQIEAMDLLDDLAASDRFRLDMDFQPGDVQVLHNHQILHARTAYEDWPEPERRRHLLRLWLSARQGRPLPPGFAERYGEIAVGRVRGGIRVPGARLVAPLEAE